MAVDDIERTRELLPDLFDHKRGDYNWVEGWTIGSLDRPDAIGHADIDGWVSNMPTNWPTLNMPLEIDQPLHGVVPVVYRGDKVVPGMPVASSGRTEVPPTDAWAFYLPFHYFSRDVWGIYLRLDGIAELTKRIEIESKGKVDFLLAGRSARRFLYFHELFHHQVESAALRIEVERRRPWYRTGFESLYRERLAAGTASEEALGNAFGITQSLAVARRERVTPHKLSALREALINITEGMPPSYRGAAALLGARAFDSACNAWIEQSRARCLRVTPSDPDVWNAATYLLRGMATIKSHVNWIVKDDCSPLVELSGLTRLVSRKKFERALNRKYGLEYVSNKGKHEKWAINGKRVPVPRHTVLNRHTVQGILKQLGINLRVEELLAGA